MITLDLEQTAPAFRAALRRTRGGVLVLTKKGKPVLAVVGIEDQYALEALALGRNTDFMAYLDDIARRMSRNPQTTATLDEVSARFDIPPTSRKHRSTRKKT